MKVKCYATADDYRDGKSVDQRDFITIKYFTSTVQGVDYVKKFARSEIYRVNLEDVAGLLQALIPVPGTLPDGRPGHNPDNPVDPDPEMPGSQVNVKIQVLPWTVKNIFPGIH